MTTEQSHASAFPGQPRNACGDPIGPMEYGLTKRELIAAIIMSGLTDGGSELAADQAIRRTDALLRKL